MTDVVVIGAGVVGAAVAYRLSEAGARVAVLEGRRAGAGTSGASFAWTNSNGKTPREYHDLNVAGMQEHEVLARELGEAPWFHRGGNVEWKAAEEERARIRVKVERLKAWGYPAEWITLAQLRELEPDLAVDPEEAAEIAYYPDEGWIDPVLLAHALLQRAARHGAVVHYGARVEELPTHGGRIEGVVTAAGQRFRADVVVNCAGPAGDAVAAMAATPLPMANTVGLLACTEPAPTTVRRVIHAAHIHLRPDGAGRLMLHTEAADHTVTVDSTPRPDLPACQDMLARAQTLIPSLAGTRVEAARIGVRPIPGDGLSAVGPLPGVENFYAVVTHSGVTLSAILGKLAAREIMSGAEEPALAAFRPARFQTAMATG